MIQPTSLNVFLDKLRDGVPFTFSRWGDGEWRSVLGIGTGANCDGHRYFATMGQELGAVLERRPKYLLGMQQLALKIYGGKISTWLTQHKLLGLQWQDADVFHKASIHGQLDQLLTALKRRKLLLVGPAHLKKAKLGHWRHVDVPPRDAYLVRDRILKDVSALAENETSLVISLSAGMPAELLLDALYERFGDRHTLVDFGSLWDPLSGVKSRSYMKNPKFQLPGRTP